MLSVLRAQAYPEVIGDNGLPWYLNALAKRDQEIADLKAIIEKLRDGRAA